MIARKTLFLIAALLLSVGVVSVEASTHREKQQREHDVPGRVPLSEETRRLAAECRRDPSDDNREALKRQVRSDYNRYIEKVRSKMKPGKNHHEYRRRVDKLTVDRDRMVEAIVRRLLAADAADGSDAPDRPRKPKSPRKKH